MTKRTPTQEKALAWYIHKYDLKVQMSAHPVYYFVDKSGTERKENIINIHSEWTQAMKEEKQADKSNRRHR